MKNYLKCYYLGQALSFDYDFVYLNIILLTNEIPTRPDIMTMNLNELITRLREVNSELREVNLELHEVNLELREVNLELWTSEILVGFSFSDSRVSLAVPTSLPFLRKYRLAR